MPDTSASILSLQPPLSLRLLFPGASFVSCADMAVAAVSADSRKCRPGFLFAALPGTRTHGARFVDQAARNGANGVLTQFPLADIAVPQCVVPDIRDAYARLCAALHGQPSRWLKTVGVTGTNGKTTVTWLVRSILSSANHTCGLLGSVEYSDGISRQPSTLTTPEPGILNGWLKQTVRRGTRFAALEVSSHALHQNRIAGNELDVAVVTNLTQDHFDYHGTLEAYRQSKMRILDHMKAGGRAVLNADDERVRRFADYCTDRDTVVTFGLNTPADFSAEIVDESLQGTRFLLRAGAAETLEMRTPLIGRHNVANCVAASAAVSHFGFSLDEIAHGISLLECVPGRLERIDCGQPFAAFVDYAHTDDALKHSIGTLKRLTPGRVICVFGAGGDRDRTKRPLLGRAALHADRLIVTSDNPRSEDPEQIIADILHGVPADSPVHTEVHRVRAIRRAVQEAQPGDSVLIAGKGHETVQIIGSQRLRFDDRDVLRRVIRESRILNQQRVTFLPQRKKQPA